MTTRKDQKGLRSDERDKKRGKSLTVEELEKRIAPAAVNKKAPVPPPYAPGTDYGLVRRDNLSW